MPSDEASRGLLYQLYVRLGAQRLRMELHRRGEIRAWRRRGRTGAPPVWVKREVIRAHAAHSGITVFVETGTSYGATIDALKHRFRKLVSIELAPDLARLAADKFSQYEHITILRGDSSVLLQQVLDQCEEPCLFWLDAHYTGGGSAGQGAPPILQELSAILSHPVNGHVVLIDDARDFLDHSVHPNVEDLDRLTSVVFHAVGILSRVSLARRALSMMSCALAVQVSALGCWLC